jgi:hypothetical protein
MAPMPSFLIRRLADPGGEARSTAQWKMAGEAVVTHHEVPFIRTRVLNLARGRGAGAQFQTFYSGDAAESTRW